MNERNLFDMNERNLFEVLETIQTHCISHGEYCDGCIFDDKILGCMFMTCAGFEGCPPSDWDILRIKKKIELDKADKL